MASLSRVALAEQRGASADLTRMDVWRYYAINQHNRNFRGLNLRGK